MDVTDRLLSMLWEGYTISAACRELNLNYNAAYRIAKKNGWSRNLRNTSVCRNSNYGEHRKTKLSEEEIFKRYDDGETLSSIGGLAGVSCEYIRQLVKRSGRESSRQKLLKLRKNKISFRPLIHVLRKHLRQRHREEAPKKKYEEDLEKWQEVRLLWSQDVCIKEIAERLNIKCTSLNWYIGKLRQKYGWFPNRKYFGLHRIKKKSEAEKRQHLLEKYANVIEYYNQGLSYNEIAKKTGRTRNSLSWVIYHLRKELNICLPRGKTG